MDCAEYRPTGCSHKFWVRRRNRTSGPARFPPLLMLKPRIGVEASRCSSPGRDHVTVF